MRNHRSTITSLFAIGVILSSVSCKNSSEGVKSEKQKKPAKEVVQHTPPAPSDKSSEEVPKNEKESKPREPEKLKRSKEVEFVVQVVEVKEPERGYEGNPEESPYYRNLGYLEAIEPVREYYSEEPTDRRTSDEEEILSNVDQPAEFPGGKEALLKFLRENIRYPEEARDLGIQGTCYIRFIVEKDGSVNKPTLMRGIAGGPECDRESMRVVKLMPAWSPGRHEGVIVRSYMILPVRYRLE